MAKINLHPIPQEQGQSKQEEWIHQCRIYTAVHKFLLGIRYFAYFITFGSQNYQLFSQDKGSVTKYLQTYNKANEQTVITLITFCQALILMADSKFTQSLDKRYPEMSLDYMIDLLKIVRIGLMIAVSLFALKAENGNTADNWTSLFAMSLAFIVTIIQKVIKILFFNFVHKNVVKIKAYITGPKLKEIGFALK